MLFIKLEKFGSDKRFEMNINGVNRESLRNKTMIQTNLLHEMTEGGSAPLRKLPNFSFETPTSFCLV